MKFKCSSSTTAPATPDIAADVGTGWAPKVRAEEKLQKSFRLGCELALARMGAPHKTDRS